MVPLAWYLIFSAALFSIGLFGVLTRKNAVAILMGVELMLNSVNVVFLALSRHFGHVDGALFVLFVMAVSAAEAAVGVAIVVAFIRRNGTTSIDAANLMKW